ncbi:MAG: hypothetical protein ACPL28_12275 [bacterium]
MKFFIIGKIGQNTSGLGGMLKENQGYQIIRRSGYQVFTPPYPDTLVS